MEEIYANVDYNKPVDPTPSTNQTGPRSSERRLHGAVVLCLGLLSVVLLVGLIILGVTYRDLAAEHSSIKAILTERLQASNDKLSSVSEERDLLNANLMERLQASNDKLSSVSEERDLLKANLTSVSKELDRLQSLPKQKRTCPAGWKMFSYTCYLFSTKTDSWENGRRDCRDRGAELAKIDTVDKQDINQKHSPDNLAGVQLLDRTRIGESLMVSPCEERMGNSQCCSSFQLERGGRRRRHREGGFGKQVITFTGRLPLRCQRSHSPPRTVDWGQGEREQEQENRFFRRTKPSSASEDQRKGSLVEELISKIIEEDTWIGLNDRDKEGTWKWIDGTPPTVVYWLETQPDNGGGNPKWGEEDCVHLVFGVNAKNNWNDVRCDKPLKWICAKMPQYLHEF